MKYTIDFESIFKYLYISLLAYVYCFLCILDTPKN